MKGDSFRRKNGNMDSTKYNCLPRPGVNARKNHSCRAWWPGNRNTSEILRSLSCPENLIQSSERSGVTASIAEWLVACRSKTSAPKNDVPGRRSTGGDNCWAATNPRILPRHHPLHPPSSRSGCVSSRMILFTQLRSKPIFPMESACESPPQISNCRLIRSVAAAKTGSEGPQ
jgi:hypothetical protein